jgi:phosphoglycerate dehydrogenase-like enzyme
MTQRIALGTDCVVPVPFQEQLCELGLVPSSLETADPERIIAIYLTGRPRLDLTQFPSLRWVHTKTAAVDEVLATTDTTVTVTNGRGLSSRAVAQHVLAIILALARDLPGLLAAQTQRTWRHSSHWSHMRKVSDVRVGIVGAGSVGSATAELLKAVGAQVQLTGRRHASPEERQYVTLNQLVATSDFLVVAAPLTRLTRNILDLTRLRKLPRGAAVINVARSGLLDHEAALALLRLGHLSALVLDVLPEEPLPPSSPLWDTPGVLITQHTAWQGERSDASLDLLVANARAFVKGEPMTNVVSRADEY